MLKWWDVGERYRGQTWDVKTLRISHVVSGPKISTPPQLLIEEQ